MASYTRPQQVEQLDHFLLSVILASNVDYNYSMKVVQYDKYRVSAGDTNALEL